MFKILTWYVQYVLDKIQSKPKLMVFLLNLLFNRRKNLAKHLGVDDSVEKQDLDKINMAILPFPSSVPKSINR